MATLPPRLTEPTGKEAELFRPLEGGKVQCTACARLCQIGEGQVGLCGVRGVVGGKLYLLVYGKIIAGHIDPIEKKPVVHYKPGSRIFSIATTGCNWLCHPAGTRILLSDGRSKNVEDLIAGDALWSYNVDAKMSIESDVVTHVGAREAQLWEVRYGAHRHGRILLTAEHPVLTQNGWKTVRELRPGDTVLRVWQHNTLAWKEKRSAWIGSASFTCRNCGQEVHGYGEWNRHRGECYTKGIPVPAEIRARTSSRMKARNPMKDPEVARRALSSRKERFLRDPSHGWHRNVERLQTWLHRHPSAGQYKLYELLDELGTAYNREHRIHVENPLNGSKSYYIADAALPAARIDVEVDGWWHFHDERVKRNDLIRDEALRRIGWEVLRVSGSYLFNHPEEVKALVAERLSIPARTNMRYWVKVKAVRPTDRVETVYSLETIPNHNYVADGILVHNCQYCQNADISQRRRVEGVDMTPEGVVELAKSYECEGLAYTYNQPTIFMEYARDVGRLARQNGIFNIFVSNGFDTPETVGMMKDFLDCITVDFKGSGETGFVRRYIGIPSADPIFQTLLETRNRTSVHIEITDLIVPQVGDNLEAADRLCKWVYDNLGPDTPVHFLRFHPDYKMKEFPWTPVETLEKHYDIGKKAGLNYVYIGNVPGHPKENTYCPGCGKVLIKRYSYDILEYNLDKNNKCRFCGHQTPILGPLSKSSTKERFIPVIN